MEHPTTTESSETELTHDDVNEMGTELAGRRVRVTYDPRGADEQRSFTADVHGLGGSIDKTNSLTLKNIEGDNPADDADDDRPDRRKGATVEFPIAGFVTLPAHFKDRTSPTAGRDATVYLLDEDDDDDYEATEVE